MYYYNMAQYIILKDTYTICYITRFITIYSITI